MFFVKTPEEFRDLVYHFVSKPDDRIPYMERSQATILANHTYHHRTAQLLHALGYNIEADEINKKYQDWLMVNTATCK